MVPIDRTLKKSVLSVGIFLYIIFHKDMLYYVRLLDKLNLVS